VNSHRDESLIAKLPGSEQVKEWFGKWPDFHDAEVINVSLAREGGSLLRVYPYYPDRPATVEFVLGEVTDLELNDFSNQNVINGLEVEAVADQSGERAYRIILAPCYGIAGWIDAKQVNVKPVPGKSLDGVSSW
jgi:hypothetical protein